jgi:hypothetical protein
MAAHRGMCAARSRPRTLSWAVTLASYTAVQYPGRMTISLFRSRKEPDLFGFTADPAGSNLPPEFGPWDNAGAGTAAASYAGTSLDGLSISDPIMKAVRQDGFYLARSGLAVMPASLHVFQSTAVPEMFGFSVVADGTNLPIENGPWEPAGDAIPWESPWPPRRWKLPGRSSRTDMHW